MTYKYESLGGEKFAKQPSPCVTFHVIITVGLSCGLRGFLLVL